MGVNLKDLLIRKPIALEDLSGKTLIVDGNNMLYQFLSTIRGRDGALLTDHNGVVTSHLIGLFSRVTALMQKNIKLAFVFDGEVPKLKHRELAKRAEVKREAEEKYQAALESKDVEGMKMFAARTSRLTKDMIAEARLLLEGLGVPVVQAPSEGEAQAAHMVKKGLGWAVASQDYDSLVCGAPRLVQNLSVEGRRKVPGKLAFKTVEPLLLDLEENLKALGISREQLLTLAVLVGTDYAPAGVKGIGPKKGLALVKQVKSREELFETHKLADDVDWREVFEVFEKLPVSDTVDIQWKPVNRNQVFSFLVEKHDFGAERVEKVLDAIAPAKNQRSLGDF